MKGVSGNTGVNPYTTYEKYLCNNIIFNFNFIIMKTITKKDLFKVFLLFFLLTGAKSYAVSGSGSVDNPFLMSSVADLLTINDHLGDPNVFFKLTSDIDFAGEADWVPIGVWNGSDFSQIFLGTLDGNGHVIKNIVINRPDIDADCGFFRGLNGPAKIRNLGFIGENASIIGRSITGTITGYAELGDESNPVEITNCYSTVSLTGGFGTGGLIGLTKGTIVSNCFATGNITSTVKAAGGLIGSVNDGAQINNCYSTGNIEVLTSGQGWDAGSLIGVMSGESSKIINSYATGSVIASQCAGGILGVINDNAGIEGCFAISRSLTSLRVNRIVAVNTSSNLVNNYSFANIEIVASSHDSIEGETTQNGLSKTKEEVTTQATYGPTGLNWDFTNVWEWPTTAYKLPVLRGLANQPTSLPSHLNSASGIDDTSANLTWNVYPNPTANIVNIQGSAVNNLKLLDFIGKAISLPDFQKGNNFVTIDLSTYPKGVYFIQVNESTLKVIKK